MGALGSIPVIGGAAEGMGGKGGKGASDALLGMAADSFAMGKPAMKAGLGMFTDAVNTGGVESRQPIYSQASEKSLQAGNQAKLAMAEDNARTGLAGTPFAEAEMKQVDLTSRQSTHTAPMEMENQDYWKILSTFFPGAGQAMGMGMQGMGTAGGLQNQQMQQLMQLGMSFNPMSK